MINTTNLEDAKKLIRKTEKPIIIQAQDDNFNRKILEYGKFDILLGIEEGNRKNKLKNINSGLNHILAKIAKKNNISIGINIEKIKTMEKEEKAERLAKIKENIEICKKASTKLRIINHSNKKQAQSLMLSLGASTKQAKEAVYF